MISFGDQLVHLQDCDEYTDEKTRLTKDSNDGKQLLTHEQKFHNHNHNRYRHIAIINRDDNSSDNDANNDDADHIIDNDKVRLLFSHPFY